MNLLDFPSFNNKKRYSTRKESTKSKIVPMNFVLLKLRNRTMFWLVAWTMGYTQMIHFYCPWAADSTSLTMCTSQVILDSIDIKVQHWYKLKHRIKFDSDVIEGWIPKKRHAHIIETRLTKKGWEGEKRKQTRHFLGGLTTNLHNNKNNEPKVISFGWTLKRVIKHINRYDWIKLIFVLNVSIMWITRIGW